MLVVWGLGRETLLAIRFGRQLTHQRRGLYPATTLQWKLDGAYSLILLFSFQFPLLLWAKLGLFLLFLFAFVFTSPVTHVFFSLIENECSYQFRQAGLTFAAHGPFGPLPSVYDTRCPS